MTELHVVASGPKADEMVKIMLEEFDRWAKHAATQAGDLWPDDSAQAAASALYDVRTDLDDHLVIAVGLTIASWGVDDSRTLENNDD